MMTESFQLTGYQRSLVNGLILKKEKVALDDHLQLILLDSLSNDKVMGGNVITCSSAYDMWKKIELLCEGSEEVRENQKQILVSQYEAFMENQGE